MVALMEEGIKQGAITKQEISSPKGNTSRKELLNQE